MAHRYRLDIEYDGTPFVGWQAQHNGLSVQQAVEEAILAFSGDEIRIRAAGRTDTGVHARGQVAHADLSKAWPADTVRDAINAHLRPLPVSILEATPVATDFDARFSATARHYHYRILNRRSQLALDLNRAWWVARPLDVDAMADAARAFVGHHDFTTFRSTDCQAKSPMRTIDRFDVRRDEDDIFLIVSARSFLHNQVRSMAGTLKLVGEGRWTRTDLEEALSARDRTRCGPVAPACGLYLARVDY